MKQYQAKFTIIACLLALSFCAGAIDIPYAESWDDLPWYGDFKTISTHRTPKVPTKFKVRVDSTSLRFLVHLTEPNIDALVAPNRAHDEPVYCDDCVEVMVDSFGAREEFVHFILNPHGSSFDSRYAQGGLVSSPGWNSQGFTSNVEIGSDFWQAEFMIPLAELEWNTGEITFNVARQRRATGANEYSSYAPAMSSFQVGSTFAQGKIATKALQPYFWEISAPYDLAIDAENRLNGKVQLTNKTGKLCVAKLSVNSGKELSVVADAGISKEVSFCVPYEGKKNIDVRLKEKDHLRALRTMPLNIKAQTIDLTLRQPAFRGNIYSDEEVNQLIGAVKTKASTSPILLTFRTKDGKILASKELQKNGDFVLDIPRIANGDYELVVKSGNDESVRLIRKLPKVAGEVRFNEHGVMLVDGKPTLPYGWFRLDLEDGRKQGYSVDAHYNAPWYSDAKLQEYLDKAGALGIKVITYCYPSGGMLANANVKKLLTENDKAAIRARVQKFSQHPALLGWYLADEPEYEPWSIERLKEIDAICHEADPWHPTIILNNSIDGLGKYVEIADISMPDYYPGFLQKGAASVPMSRYTKFMQFAAKQDSRIHWAVPQGFDWTAYGSKDHRPPNYNELRSMHYQSLCSGANGIVWYSFELNYAEPSVHIYVRDLLRETRLLEELWLHPEKRHIITGLEQDLFAASYADVNSKNYLIVGNLSEKNNSFQCPVSSDATYYDCHGKAYMPVAGNISDTLGCYETKIYVTEQAEAQKLQIPDLGEEVLQAEKALHKPGNLLYYKKTTAKLESSVMTEPRYPLHILTDGSTHSLLCFDVAKDSRCEVKITFPQPVTLASLQIYGRDMRSFSVKIDEKELSKFQQGSGVEHGQLSWSPITTDHISICNFKGFGISEIELYSQEISIQKQAEFVGATSRELAYWSFDNDSAACLKNLASDLDLIPEKTIPSAQFVEGVKGNALYLPEDSEGRYMCRDMRLTALTPPFTIACWIKKTNAEPKQSIIAATAADRAPYGFEFTWSWRRLLFRCACNEGKDIFALTTPTASLPNDSWCHVAVTVDKKVVKLYVDGKMMAEKEFPENWEMTPANGRPSHFTIGHYPTSFSAYKHVGLLDEMHVFSYALSLEEIENLLE